MVMHFDFRLYRIWIKFNEPILHEVRSNVDTLIDFIVCQEQSMSVQLFIQSHDVEIPWLACFVQWLIDITNISVAALEWII